MTEQTNARERILSEFRIESELFFIKKALVPKGDERAFIRAESFGIIDFLAKNFQENQIRVSEVLALKKGCMSKFHLSQSDDNQISILIDAFNDMGLDLKSQSTIASKLAILWLVIEGPGWASNALTTNDFVSYAWRADNKSISSLYEDMLGKWIDESTTLEQFRLVFSKHPLSEISPIRWKRSVLSEVMYFVIQMHENGIIGNYEDILRMDYEQLSACFVKPDGSSFNSHKQVKNNVRLFFSEKKKEHIQALVKKVGLQVSTYL